MDELLRFVDEAERQWCLGKQLPTLKAIQELRAAVMEIRWLSPASLEALLLRADAYEYDPESPGSASERFVAELADALRAGWQAALSDAGPARQSQPDPAVVLNARRWEGLQKALNEPGAAEEDARVEANARRYEWLRDNGAALAALGEVTFRRNKWLDAAIDAAMSADVRSQAAAAPPTAPALPAGHDSGESKKSQQNSGPTVGVEELKSRLLSMLYEARTMYPGCRTPIDAIIGRTEWLIARSLEKKS